MIGREVGREIRVLRMGFVNAVIEVLGLAGQK